MQSAVSSVYYTIFLFMQKLFFFLASLFAMNASYAQFSPWYEGSRCLYHQAEGNCAAFGGKLFVFNGFTNPEYDPACSLGDGQCISDTLAFFDPQSGPGDSLGRPLGSWQQFVQMPLPVTHVDVSVVDAEIWLVGGFMGDHGGQATNKVQIYNPAMNQWRYGPDLPVAHASGTTAQLGRKVYVTHGSNHRGGINERHFVFDLDHPALGWKDLRPPPLSLNHVGVAVMRGKIYTVGGQKCHDCFPSFHQSSLMEYDPEKDRWSYLDSMPQNRSHIEPSVFAMDGKLYVGGGNSDQGFKRDIIEYDPDSRQWRQVYYFPSPDGGQFTSYWAPSVKPIGDQLIFAHGGLNDYTAPRDQTFLLPIQRQRRHELVFSKDSLFFRLPVDTVVSAEILLWTYSGETAYDFELGNAPAWLAQVNGRMSLRPSGDEVGFSIRTDSMAAGVYYYELQAVDADTMLPAFSPASMILVLEVKKSPNVGLEALAATDWHIEIPHLQQGFHFFTETSSPAFMQWKIIDMKGNSIFEGSKYVASSGRHKLGNNMHNMPPGMYLLWVRRNEKEVLVKKFLR